MDGQGEPAGHRVLRQGEQPAERVGGRRGVPGHHQEAVPVVPARGTHRIHEGLIEQVNAFRGRAAVRILRGETPLQSVPLEARLVHGLEDQMFVIPGEAVTKLVPHPCKIPFSRGIKLFGEAQVLRRLVMVGVQDHI